MKEIQLNLHLRFREKKKFKEIRLNEQMNDTHICMFPQIHAYRQHIQYFLLLVCLKIQYNKTWLTKRTKIYAERIKIVINNWHCTKRKLSWLESKKKLLFSCFFWFFRLMFYMKKDHEIKRSKKEKIQFFFSFCFWNAVTEMLNNLFSRFFCAFEEFYKIYLNGIFW